MKNKTYIFNFFVKDNYEDNKCFKYRENEGEIMKFLKGLGKFSLVGFIVFVIIHIGLYVYCLITPKMDINKAQSYYLYDVNMEEILGKENDWISLDKVSDYVIKATLSTEDKYFYKHFGFDYGRIAKAMVNNIVNRNMSEGASTITQQYARNLFLNFDKTWSRKIDEAMLAMELEAHYSKDEILEGYLNTINYGGIFGIENAANYYFGKSAEELSLAEASMLAGIPQSPNNYSPLINEDLAKKRQRVVLTLMVKNNDISQEEADLAFNTNLSYIGNSDDDKLEYLFYFRDAVIDELKEIAQIPTSLIETGGLKIYTTLDKKAQESLETSVKKEMRNSGDIEVAGMMMNPKNGAILAVVGGKDYSASQFNRAINSKRQVGSTMKPFLYYTALESGFTSASSFTSEKTTFTFSNNQNYTPKNYNDKYAEGPISMGAAISYSDNIYAVKTNLFLGEEMLVNMAKRVGIEEELDAIPSLALGTGEISLKDMMVGYSAFANLGNKVEGHFIERVEDSRGNVLYEFKEKEDNVLNPSLTFILNEMLTYTYDSEFIDYNYPTIISLLPQITKKYAIKSGTTNTDLWIMGYNPDVVVGIWNGYDDNRVLNEQDNKYHKNIWINTIEKYLENKDSNWYEVPNNVVGVLVNPITGKIATDEDKKKKVFYFIKGTEPYANKTFPDLDAVFKEDDNKKNE